MSKYVGKSIKRTEDPRLIKGLAHYVDDVRLPDTLHVAFVRSIYAHARIDALDTTEAASTPGVVAVYTGKDIAEKVGPVPCAAALPDLKVPDYRVLATGKALFVGHPIAAVVATDKYAARDAVDLIEVDYEELPVVVDVEISANGGPVIHESATRRQDLPGRADVGVGARVVVELLAREGAVLSPGLVDDGDVRGDLLVFDQPVQHRRRSIGGVRGEPLRLETKSLLGALEHGPGRANLGSGERRVRPRHP